MSAACDTVGGRTYAETAALRLACARRALAPLTLDIDISGVTKELRLDRYVQAVDKVDLKLLSAIWSHSPEVSFIYPLGEELARAIDPRRFRANVVLDLPDSDGFYEDALVGKTIRIGERVTLAVLERDQRCAMIGIDPDTAERDRDIPLHVTKAHDSKVGVYAAVLVEGIVRAGDAVTVVG